MLDNGPSNSSEPLGYAPVVKRRRRSSTLLLVAIVVASVHYIACDRVAGFEFRRGVMSTHHSDPSNIVERVENMAALVLPLPLMPIMAYGGHWTQLNRRLSACGDWLASGLVTVANSALRGAAAARIVHVATRSRPAAR